jgi:hypothetical protein
MDMFSRSVSRWRWFAYLNVMLVAASGAAVAGAQLARAEGGCWSSTISALISPDDVWVALVRQEICSDGLFVTTVVDKVQLVRRISIDTIPLGPRPDEPIHENDVFGIEEAGYPPIRPLTRWLSPDQLEISIPNLIPVGSQKSEYEGVQIVVKHNPDDPAASAAREQWLIEHGLRPK